MSRLTRERSERRFAKLIAQMKGDLARVDHEAFLQMVWAVLEASDKYEELAKGVFQLWRFFSHCRRGLTRHAISADIGVVLSAFTALVARRMGQRDREQSVASFCRDLMESVFEITNSMEEMRAKTKVIDHEFLELLAFEIGCYGRNREHLVALTDKELRHDAHSFFLRLSAIHAKIRAELGRFYDQTNAAKAATDGSQAKKQAEAAANAALLEARTGCDRLREHCNNNTRLKDRLERTA